MLTTWDLKNVIMANVLERYISLGKSVGEVEEEYYCGIHKVIN